MGEHAFNYKDAGLRGKMQEQHSLATMNAWRVGGVAEYLYEPADREDLATFFSVCPDDMPITVLGLGSNLLIRDGGVGGVVLNLRPAFGEISSDANKVFAGSGVTCAKVARYSARKGLQGLAFMAGIPGTVGGAIAMNAGAYGEETWSFLSEVETIGRGGETKNRTPADYAIAYRSVTLKGDEEEWFLVGHFELTPGGDAESLEREIREMLKRRNSEQPTSQLNCGSVFRNPENDYAGRLIEHCGLKKHAIGDAEVSEKHANFIINRGKATAHHIESLIEYVRARVEDETGVRLEPEVRIIGKDIDDEERQ